MHMVIYALVEASTHDDALATGKTVFDRLVGTDPHAGAVFDYYVCFDEEDTSVAGKARWGELPTAAPVDSDDGQDLLERGCSPARSPRITASKLRMRFGSGIACEKRNSELPASQHRIRPLLLLKLPNTLLELRFPPGVFHVDRTGLEILVFPRIDHEPIGGCKR
ncbi:hypothetical protein [Natrinema soli]|uniref:DUF7995 domain-containing protein n=1 Tax=Natrinema soli TaxID=1930624 RepID=A0ABD5SYM7_9EURY